MERISFTHCEIFDADTLEVIACTVRIPHEDSFSSHCIALQQSGSIARLTLGRLQGDRRYYSRGVWGG